MNKFILDKSIVKKDWFWLTLIIAAGLGLRLWLMGFLTSFTFDETVSFSVAAKPLGQIWSYVQWEMHPPLHYYFLHFWLVLFGATEVSAHLSSIFLSLLTIIALYLLGKEVFAKGMAGLAAAALYAFSSYFCYYGIWVRMNTMLFLLATLSFLFFLKLTKSHSRQTPVNAALFTFFTLAALFTHLTAGLLFAIDAVYLAYLWLTKQSELKPLLAKFVLPFLIIFAAYGLWFWNFWQSRLSGLRSDAWYFHISGQIEPWFIIALDSIKFLTPFDGYFFNLLAFSLLAILGFCSFAAISLDRKQGLRLRTYFSSGAFFCWLVFFLSFFGLFLTKLFVLRYAIIPAIGLFLILGYGWSMADRYLRVALIGLFCLLSIMSFWAFSVVTIDNASWKGAADFISQNERPGDKIAAALYFDLLPLDFYYRGKLPAAAPLDEKYRGNDLLRTTIKTNVYPTTDQANIVQLAGFLGNSRRIFLLVSDGEGAFPAVPLIAESWLQAQGFVKVREWPGVANRPAYVWLMEKK
ncbi:MAG: glycosyltransferase family 39 protein [Patescibacteria group bacterium]|nr:glycosyltransferase family 39 protein [Patescibacteria group bacterium]